MGFFRSAVPCSILIFSELKITSAVVLFPVPIPAPFWGHRNLEINSLCFLVFHFTCLLFLFCLCLIISFYLFPLLQVLLWSLVAKGRIALINFGIPLFHNFPFRLLYSIYSEIKSNFIHMKCKSVIVSFHTEVFDLIVLVIIYYMFPMFSALPYYFDNKDNRSLHGNYYSISHAGIPFYPFRIIFTCCCSFILMCLLNIFHMLVPFFIIPRHIVLLNLLFYFALIISYFIIFTKHNVPLLSRCRLYKSLQLCCIFKLLWISVCILLYFIINMLNNIVSFRFIKAIFSMINHIGILLSFVLFISSMHTSFPSFNCAFMIKLVLSFHIYFLHCLSTFFAFRFWNLVLLIFYSHGCFFLLYIFLLFSYVLPFALYVTHPTLEDAASLSWLLCYACCLRPRPAARIFCFSFFSCLRFSLYSFPLFQLLVWYVLSFLSPPSLSHGL